MARAYRCDICDAFFGEIVSIQVKGKAVCLRGQYTNTEKDICPKCMMAIQQIIDKRSKKDAK